MRIKSIFHIIQGHQITDEDIYKSIGNIPIFTAKNEIKGYWDKAIISQQDLPCITYPTKANSGQTFIHLEIFDANNTAVLVPQPLWKEHIILEWAAMKLANIFLRIATSKEGVSYLNKDIVNELDFEVPDEAIQQEELRTFSKLIELRKECDNIIDRIERINNSALAIDYQEFQARDVPAAEIFSSISGNSGLTEEYIYSVRNMNTEKWYKLLTGSIEVDDMPTIPLCSSPQKSIKKIKVYEGEGIHIVRKGKAGYVTYLPLDNYTLNDDAYILTLKPNCKLNISLNWLVNTNRPLFYEFATKSDNGTWNKASFFEHSYFDIPARIEQDTIANKLTALKSIENKLNELRERILSLLTRETF